MAPMSRSRLTAICAALTVLFAGVLDVHAHIHLCFDEAAPATVVHGHDHGEHAHMTPGPGHAHTDHAHHAPGSNHGGGHGDLDVDVEQPAVVKNLDHDWVAAAAMPSAWHVPSPRRVGRIVPIERIEPHGSPQHPRARPRAPPR